MKHNVFYSIFDQSVRIKELRDKLNENGSVEMLHFSGAVYKVFAIVKNTIDQSEMVAYRCIKSTEDFEADMDTFWVTPIAEFLRPVDLDEHPGCQFDFEFMFKDDAEMEMVELLTGKRN